MGKTFRRDSQFRPRKQGRSFSKDNQPWKKNKHKDNRPTEARIPNVSDYQDIQ